MKKLYLLILFQLVFTNAFSQKEIWGSAMYGGEYHYGYIFKTDSIGDNLTVMHSFNWGDGALPGELLSVSNNKLYGITSYGGQHAGGIDTASGGTFFEYDMSTSSYAVIQHLGPGNTVIPGDTPYGEGMRTLSEGAPGIIYGELRGYYGGSRFFTYNINTGIAAVAANMLTFQGGFQNQTTGIRANSAFYKHTDGYLYATSYVNSTCPIAQPNFGCIYRLDPANNTISMRYRGECSMTDNGYLFRGNFVPYNGELYSTTLQGGGPVFKGVIYSFNPQTSVYTKHYSFEGGELGGTSYFLTKANNGKFYGIADGGISEPNLQSGGGILYEFDPTTNIFTKKYNFLYGDGWNGNVGPFASSLISGHNGKLYGATDNGIFEYNPATNEMRAAGRSDVSTQSFKLTLTKVCRKPSYIPSVETVRQSCEGSIFVFDLQSENATNTIWLHNNIPDTSKTGTILAFDAISLADAGSWSAQLTNECGTTNTIAFYIAVQPKPVVIQNGSSLITLSDATSYQWIYCDSNLPISNATGATYSPEVDGNFSVNITSNNCALTSDCFLFSTLGLGGVSDNTIVVYPNPAGNELLLKGITGIISGAVYNVTGQRVMEITSNRLDVAGLQSGVYFIGLIVDNQTRIGKFVKR
ncbi:MAG: T9SS type A sorting domain-containing protein [Flavobacterium sp.]|nr:T9SS type A sorting domain-containing protein [Flavobacterium sp.]